MVVCKSLLVEFALVITLCCRLQLITILADVSIGSMTIQLSVILVQW